jgi:hypothetical protein
LWKNYWDVTQYVGWSSRKLLLKRSESRGECSTCPSRGREFKRCICNRKGKTWTSYREMKQSHFTSEIMAYIKQQPKCS